MSKICSGTGPPVEDPITITSAAENACLCLVRLYLR